MTPWYWWIAPVVTGVLIAAMLVIGMVLTIQVRRRERAYARWWEERLRRADRSRR